eukprot:1152560-Pelagomonas_calceolata.AAC.4
MPNWELNRAKSKKWSPTEVQQLLDAINAANCAPEDINWAAVAENGPVGRTGKQCREKYKVCSPPACSCTHYPAKKRKGLLRCEAKCYLEDRLLTPVRTQTNGRASFPCALPQNDLRPDLSKAPWTGQEEYILARAHCEIGNQWAEIARFLPGRSENTIKNKWCAPCQLVSPVWTGRLSRAGQLVSPVWTGRLIRAGQLVSPVWTGQPISPVWTGRLSRAGLFTCSCLTAHKRWTGFETVSYPEPQPSVTAHIVSDLESHILNQYAARLGSREGSTVGGLLKM